jgi:hypothetical protein
MKYQAFWGLAVVSGALVVACSSSGGHAPPIAGGGGDTASGGRTGSGGKSSGGDTDGGLADAASGGTDAGDGGGAGGGVNGGAGGGGPGGSDAGSGPVVTITSPKAATDPSSPDVLVNGLKNPSGDAIVVNDAVTVVCKVAKGADSKGVDTSTVKLEMLAADGKTSLASAPVGGTGNPDEYSAQFVIAENKTTASVPNGKVSFRCSAKDLGGLTSSDTITTFVDHGPAITPGKPTEGSPHPLTGGLEVSFQVAPAPLSKTGDTGAAVTAVNVQINGVAFPQTVTADGNYKLNPSPDLTDKVLFKTTPVGPIPFVITATDERNATRSIKYDFVVDSQGPTIEIKKPDAGTIIGRKQLLQFTVTDETGGSGVDPTTVLVTVNQKGNRYDAAGPWTRVDNAYSFSLDAASITNATVQVTVNIDAKDLAGNPALGASAVYNIDTVPPIVDLDPPPLQEIKADTGKPGTFQCSLPFDPLGEAASDGDVVQSLAAFRAVAYDLTNGPTGGVQLPYAGIDPKTVILYAQQPDPSTSLLVDTNGDQTCDDVDLTLNLPIAVLVPAGVTGSSDYRSVVTIPGVTCETAGAPGQPLCSNQSSMTRIIQHERAGAGTADSVVYGIRSQVAPECPGAQWGLAPNGLKNGWVCLAARAVDNVGNVGVSTPLRVCLNDQNSPAPTCASVSETPPPCWKGCTPPPHFTPHNLTSPFLIVPN